MSVDIKLIKAEICKIIKSDGSFGSCKQILRLL